MDWRQNEREEITMMKDKMTSSLKLNFIMNAILTMSSFIFPLIAFPYVSRILMPEGTGTVSFATSVVTYFALFAQLGIPTYGIRACAKVRDDREALTQTAQEIFLINCVMSILTYAVFFAVLFRVPKMQAEKPLFLVISLTIFFNMIGMDWLYKGLERYTYITVTSIIFKFIALLAMFALIHEKSDYVIYGGISIFAASASNVCNLMNVHKYINLKPMGHYQFGRHMQPIMVFFAMSCATTIYTNLDTVMLGFMKSNTDVGYYNAAVKIKNVLLAVVTSLGTVLLPRASYYVEHHEMEKFHEITRKAIRFVFLIAVPLMVYFMLFASESVLFLSGEAYIPAILPMQIIMPTLVLIGLTNIMGIQMLVPLGQEKKVLYSEIAGAAVDLILNAILIPRVASVGAAIGTLAAEAVVWLVQFAALKKMVRPAYKEVSYGKITVGVLIGVIASLWVKNLHIGSFLTLLLSAVLFFGAYGGLLTLLREPLVWEIEQQMLGKIFHSSQTD